MAEYLQTKLREHPRTRRFGELIADIAYPISSAVVGSSLVPFHGTLLNGVNSLKSTSDYIFQQPYERLLTQFEESRKMKEDLEQQILSSQIEFESLKCVECPSCSQREERIVQLEDQHKASGAQILGLERSIRELTDRVEDLLTTISEKEGENDLLRADVAEKEEALYEALRDLEVIRRKGEESARPTIETSESGTVGYRSQGGILTPESIKEHHLSTWSVIDHDSSYEPTLAQSQSQSQSGLPGAFLGSGLVSVVSGLGFAEEHAGHVDESECGGEGEERVSEEREGHEVVEEHEEEGDEHEQEERDEIQSQPTFEAVTEAEPEPAEELEGQTQTHVEEDGEDSMEPVVEAGVEEGSVPSLYGENETKEVETTHEEAVVPDVHDHPVEAEVAAPVVEKEDSASQDEVKEDTNAHIAEDAKVDTAPVAEEESGERAVEDGEKKEEEKIDMPVPELAPSVPSQDVDVGSSMAGEPAAVYLNDVPEVKSDTVTKDVPISSTTGRQSPSGSTNSTSHGNGHVRSHSSIPVHSQKNVQFSSFGFAGPDIPQPQRTPTSASKKKHSFFSRHHNYSGSNDESGNGASVTASGERERDQNSTSEKEKRGLHKRVFSATSIGGRSSSKGSTSPARNGNGKRSDDEASVHSSGSSGAGAGIHSKEMANLSASIGSNGRPDSPSPSTKLGRHHSHFFRDHVKIPLERKASQIAHKGRELLKHESEHLGFRPHSPSPSRVSKGE